ncbi:MAG: helix-turn-helix transcriptional regulator [Acidaminococcaceae bacterium]|nr:helix-turn-helix transcriptional regulator [Acidaminococcaceae bacterium]
MNKIEEVRRVKGMTRNELSKRSGVSNKMLWEYERGKRDPSLATLRKIAKALGVKIQEVVW